MNKFFKVFMVLFTIALVIATIAEILAPARMDGWGVQWPVYMVFWALNIFLWLVAAGRINLIRSGG